MIWLSLLPAAALVLWLLLRRPHPWAWDGGHTPPWRPMDNQERRAAWAARYYLTQELE